ncbi:response regulator transcription factor [Anaerotalea alkaliphila]|uniref:Stage 0 sporulation protein A homolog n=1 Tax=Anaerotalea alkaliphila TaxID=2662126 RepID=A0A7X5HWE4_9FIRM|nr:response regulator [Anaerotalea alkaliphila]NDL67691.1 response regulator [Anaerotalea alkaliphila]
MKKVLIADDELLVRIGLKTTIDWEKNGFSIVGEAQNGKEAIELFDRYDPDILITDIRMPIIDGLQLIQTLQKKKKNLKSIILTHYDDFAYAQKAIKLGASEYILKHNLSSEELLGILKRLSLEISSAEGETSRQPAEPSVLPYQSSLEQILEKSYLSAVGKHPLKDLLDKNSLSVEYPSFFILFGKLIYNSDKEIDMRENTLIKNMSKSLLLRDNSRYAEISSEENLLLLFNIDFLTDNPEAEQLEYALSLEKHLQQFLEIDMIFGISRTSKDVYEIPLLLDQARTAAERHYFDGSKTIFFYNSLEETHPVACSVDYNGISEHVDTLDCSRLHDYIDAVFQTVYPSYDINSVNKIFIDFISFARILYFKKHSASDTEVVEKKFDYSNFWKLDSFDSIKKYVHDTYDFIFASSGSRKSLYSAVIAKSIAYIKRNYMRNISLEEVAASAEISKSYLSLLFKQETGIKFSDFLANYRIEQSKKLILETNCKVYEIAEHVGFDNPYYFSRVFKDRVGMSCKEFKNKHHANDASSL